MEETITTDPFLSNLTSEYVDYGENIDQTCFISLELKAIAAVCMAISLCGLVGNGLVMWFLKVHVKQNPITNYTKYVALSDLLMLLLFLLLMLAVLSLSAICFYDLMSSYLPFVYAVSVVYQYLVLSSLSLLAAGSVEQCLAGFFPAWYHYHCPKYCSHIVLLIILALNGFFGFLRYLSPAFRRSVRRAYPGVAIAVCTILSLMLVSNLALFIKLRCGSDRRHPRKAHVAVLLSVIFFLALGIPFTVEIFLYLPHSYVLFPEIASLTSFLLGSLNSSIKPLLYFLLGSCQQRHFQCSIRDALQRVFEEEATREDRNQEPGDAVMDSVL